MTKNRIKQESKPIEPSPFLLHYSGLLEALDVLEASQNWSKQHQKQFKALRLHLSVFGLRLNESGVLMLPFPQPSGKR